MKKTTREEKELRRRNEMNALIAKHRLTQAEVREIIGIRHDSSMSKKLSEGPITKAELNALKWHLEHGGDEE